ncbi:MULTISPECIES: recombinase family protein [unclassified Streptomyces]|uniref:recombinase family protein n=1 Tax=unclassified Streptomyces TaxID=2593676 RepID=UPI002DD94AD5|nr:recombinase family protein [Streptomyces sp. NBC_01750]WSB00821.1 recombinase family protein [Streptomyces sp. NBC_01794]WSD34824.1 recombinase family protein [Streptomyces sp. NBC_01750]
MTTNTATGHLIGYARVSTDDQEAQLQRDALTEAGCSRIFEDKASGRNTDRPELTAVLDYLREGDALVAWKLDRLGRSLIDLVSIVDGLRERGIGFKVLTGALSAVDTTSADGRLFFQIIAAMAEFERSLIKDRTKAGLEAAKAQGRTGGRPTVITDDLLTVAEARKAKGESVSAIAKALGVSRATLYRHLS